MTYTGTGGLLKAYLRGNKVITLLLVFLPFILAYGIAASNIAVINTPDALSAYISQNQGNIILGRIAANTIAAVSAWRVRVSAAVIMAILNIVLTVAHTRKDEDMGRLEMLRAGAVGNRAPLMAVFVKIYGANLIGGALMAIAFIAVGFPVAGALVTGFATSLCSCFFAGLAGIAAQAADNASSARGISFGAAAVFMVILIIANALQNDFLLLFTPFGWCAYARPFAGENPWMFVFAILTAALLVFIAIELFGHRDLGAGYFRADGGRSSAGNGFRSPLALAWRLQRVMFFVWAIAYALMGLAIGALASSINQMLGGTAFLPELSTKMGGAGSAFLAILSYILAQVLTAYAILAVLRIREEESMTRADLMLSRPVSRIKYMSGHLLIAFAGSAAALIFFGLFSGNLAGCIIRLPAICIVASVAALTFGLAPRSCAGISWGVFGALLLLELLWELRVVGNGVFGISPFSWVYPGTAVSPVTVVFMLFIAAVLTGIGFYGFCRRDIIPE